MSIFEKASRAKLHFTTERGVLLTEDLWDLPLTSSTPGRPNLDSIARSLHKQLKSGDDVSFVTPEKKLDEVTQLKFDIVKYIIDVKLQESKTALNEKERKARKQKLLELYERKQDQVTEALSLEEIKKMLEAV